MLSSCGDTFSLDDIERLPKPLLYLNQDDALCGSYQVIDGNRTTYFEQGCEASSTGLRRVGTITNGTYNEITSLIASFPDPFSLPPQSDCVLRKEIVLIAEDGKQSAWSICADNQAFEGSLLFPENILKEIRN